MGTATPAYAKVPQKTVKYQDTPKGEQACESCSLFEAPSSCKTVDGTVSPKGWCMVNAKETRLDFKKYISARFRTGY
jgi:hypothetical protein